MSFEEIGGTPTTRITVARAGPARRTGSYVLYWMVAARRVDHSFGLQRAVGWARDLGKPLLILEALRVDYPWASDRLHRFVLDGMAANARRLRGNRVEYYPYVEPRPGAGRGLLAALARDACVVVTDDFPAFFLGRMVAAATRVVPVRFEIVDSNGLLPLRAAPRAFPTARGFRRFLQTVLPEHLRAAPRAHPLRGAPLPALDPLPPEITRRWPAAEELGDRDEDRLGALPIDHSVPPVAIRGGVDSGVHRLRRFLTGSFQRYAEARNHPDEDATSGLAPYLHFGHISVHRVLAEVASLESWSLADVSEPDGRREGWWGMSPNAEAFLEQLVTWRELGFNMCAQRADYDRYESLPEWALATLDAHARDPRDPTYVPAQLEEARTHDRLWNAAQRQLRSEGRIHTYLRMLWGKKILEWSPSPREALEVMIDLNNRYALDGRDPNSYSGILWCFGRYDRPWGPERPVFGKVRYMSSENTARKLRLRAYLERYSSDHVGQLGPQLG